MTDYDVVLVGGGHNGLVCASYLAKGGRKVLVVEAREGLGGAAASREFVPGYTVSACAHWLTHLAPSVHRDLALERHGLQLAARDLETIGLSPEEAHVSVRGSEVTGVGAGDRQAFAEFHRKTGKFARFLAKAFAVRPPRLVESNLTDRINLLKLALGMKMMGREDMRELMRLALINMYDVMEENFDSEPLKALLSFDGVLGAHMGPRSPNTVFGYLYQRVGEAHGYRGPALVEGGMGALGEALAGAAKAAGVEIRTAAPVASIDLDGSRVTGVTLVGGEVVKAPLVVSNADPVTTFEKLVGFRNVETGLVRRVSQIRMRSGVAKLHLALDGTPSFRGLDASRLGQRLVIAPTMDYVERAFNSAKYGETSIEPALDISIPSVHDASLAPPGKHVLSAIVQFAPYDLREGWEHHREVFTRRVIDVIDAYAPGIKGLVTGAELLTPVDIEREFGMTGGHWHHGEISLDQVMMMRPFPGASQYGTAVDGLYLCGAGSHPGGGVMGLAGANAAREILNRGARA